MHKLSKTFAELPGPKRSSELFKMKLDEFKKHLPLLQTFCNPGIRDRHWEKVSAMSCELFISYDMLALLIR